MTFGPTAEPTTKSIIALALAMVQWATHQNRSVMELIDNTGLTVIEREECLKLLAGEEVGRLAVVVGGRPEIFPVNYVVHDGGVVFRTDPGTKLAGAVRGPVSFEVDHLDRATRTAWSVILHGHAHQITAFDSPEVLDRSAHLALYPWTRTPKAHLVRIAPTTITGRWIKGGSGRAPISNTHNR